MVAGVDRQNENEMADEQVEHVLSNELVVCNEQSPMLKVWDLIFDAADDEDDSYAEAENDNDCNSDTDGDLNAGVPQDFPVPDFRNTPDPDDIFALR
eukprot:Em0003g1501a